MNRISPEFDERPRADERRKTKALAACTRELGGKPMGLASYKGGSCLPDGLLVTFKPGTNADAALIKILDRRVWAREPYRLNSDNINKPERVISQFDGKTYVNMALFLDLTSQKQQ